MRKLKILMLLGTTGILSSCDLSQIPGLDKRLNIEDSKAIGAACRHSGRALEDCFTLNPLALQSGVFEGWRDMNDYMVANKIETVEPQIQSSNYKPGAKEDTGHGASEPAPPAGVSVRPGSAAGAWTPPGGAASQSPLQAPATSGEGQAAGRQRWQPGQSGSTAPVAPHAGVSPPASASNQPATQAPAQASSPPLASEGSTAVQPPKSDGPARPWERKSGAKNTT